MGVSSQMFFDDSCLQYVWCGARSCACARRQRIVVCRWPSAVVAGQVRCAGSWCDSVGSMVTSVGNLLHFIPKLTVVVLMVGSGWRRLWYLVCSCLQVRQAVIRFCEVLNVVLCIRATLQLVG